MAEKIFESNDALTIKLYHERFYRDARKGSYFERLMGESDESVVQTKTDLSQAKGDKMTFGISYRLRGEGVPGDNILEGHEEDIETADFDITLDQLRHATRSGGRMSERRTHFRVPQESRDKLRVWMSEKIDQKCFDALDVSPSKIIYGGNATSTADIDTADKITLALISKLKTVALTGFNRTQVPLRPIMIGGKRHFILLVHPDVEYDLRQDSSWQQAQREAEIRGAQNPLFTGAQAIWDNVVIHSHENIPIVANWGAGANVPGSRCQFLGAQSLCWAWGERPWMTEETFDYKNKTGWSIAMIYAVKKPKFTQPSVGVAKDYGSIAVYVSRTQVSDAA